MNLRRQVFLVSPSSQLYEAPVYPSISFPFFSSPALSSLSFHLSIFIFCGLREGEKSGRRSDKCIHGVMTWGGCLRTETFVLWLKELLSLEMCFVALVIPATSSNTYIYTCYIYSVILAVHRYNCYCISAVLCLSFGGVKELGDGHSWWILYPCRSVPVPCLEVHAASLTRCRPTDQVAYISRHCCRNFPWV